MVCSYLHGKEETLLEKHYIGILQETRGLRGLEVNGGEPEDGVESDLQGVEEILREVAFRVQ